MKIFSYYNDIHPNNSRQDLEMINLWKISWERNGFDPIVLRKDSAESNPIYEKFIKLIKKIHLNIRGSEIDQYSESCFIRWLAYANQQTEEHFLMSDYDVINKNLKAKDIVEAKNKLSFLDEFCPSLAYGNTKQIASFCQDIINISSQNEFLIKKYSKKLKIESFHDQDFLYLIFKIFEDLSFLCGQDIKDFCEKLNIVKDKYIMLYQHEKRHEISSFPAYHIANRSAHEAKFKYSLLKEKDHAWIRILFMNLILLEEDDVIN
jgi:hypothetical protein